MKREKYNSDKAFYFISIVIFTVYVLFMIYRLYFYAYGSYPREYSNIYKYNLIPFHTIKRYLLNYNNLSFNVWFFNLFGNIAAFMPLGFFLPIIFRSANSGWRIITISAISVFVAEAIQFLTRLGTFDIDDIILNTLGGYFGYLMMLLLAKLVKGRRRMKHEY